MTPGGGAAVTDEKRRHTRVSEKRYAALRVVDDGVVIDDQGFCVMIDISLGGCRLRTSVRPEVGATVEADIGFGEDVRTFPGIVRNTRTGEGRSHEIGIEFIDMTTESAGFIRDLVNEQDTQQA